MLIRHEIVYFLKKDSLGEKMENSIDIEIVFMEHGTASETPATHFFYGAIQTLRAEPERREAIWYSVYAHKSGLCVEDEDLLLKFLHSASEVTSNLEENHLFINDRKIWLKLKELSDEDRKRLLQMTHPLAYPYLILGQPEFKPPFFDVIVRGKDSALRCVAGHLCEWAPTFHLQGFWKPVGPIDPFPARDTSNVRKNYDIVPFNCRAKLVEYSPGP
ncbi:MAG: hypothetical protein PHY92_10170 [Alphaproteobacteria bacterium]|nr:hypothetical protein [Alphaproteobacteria bacterium]